NMDRHREQRRDRGSVDDKYNKDRKEREQEKVHARRRGEDVKDRERKRRVRDDDYKEEERRKASVEVVDDADKKNTKRTHNAGGGKSWTLDGESDEEEEADGGDVKEKKEIGTNGDAMDEDEIDPLDAFIISMVIPQVTTAVLYEKRTKDANSYSEEGYPPPKLDNDDEEDPLEDDDEFMKRVKKTKVDKLSLVDHSKIDYIPFRKNLYIQVKDIQNMTHEQVVAYRKQVELKIHGKDVPKPIQSWHQAGLTTKVLDTIVRKMKCDKPMPIQAQALPVIMSGRDCIGVAKTGSGKTLAFILPMLRHVMDQPPLESGDGPIGLIMAPTRELVRQIHSDIKKFTKKLGLKCVPVYGGAGVARQIRQLKRGAEIVVCTSGGKIMNLTRVSYLVMDEADRMFDMGFEPQITRIVQNTQPNRQTLLFSATFPRQVEVLARKVLNKPVEIQVGGRSVVNKDITQLVEVRPPGNERFYRLLELLG
ncbi:DEAD-box ATP-dependent RNA helicase 42, partial [Tanacetum coccineum]